MRNYREVAEAVLERRDAYEKKRKHTRRIVIRTAAGTGGLCLATLLGLSVLLCAIIFDEYRDATARVLALRGGGDHEE